MKYLPLKNQPNVSRTRFQSMSPSMQLDGRGYPHIVWLEEREGANDLSYSYWDGLKWSYLGTSKVYVSKDEVTSSPNALILNNQDEPLIVFSRKTGTGSKLSLATYSDTWSFNSLNVIYSVGWIGIAKRSEDTYSSSSSSGGSEDNNYYVVVYDITNSEFKIYSVDVVWTLVGSKAVDTSSYLTTKITVCDTKIAIAFIEDNTSIEYNYFDVITDLWSFGTFTTMAASILYGDIIDMDLEGYNTVGVESFCVGWLSGNTISSYINSAICLSDGTVTPADLSSYNVESNLVDVISNSVSYLVNGYRKIGITLDDSGLCQIVCLGVSSKIFSLSALNVWSEDLIDLEAVSNGNVYTYLDINYFGDVKIVIGADSGDIYYFEPSSDTTFPVANPEVILLSGGDFAYKITSFSPMQGSDILDLYNNYYGQVLKDARIPLLITSNRIL